eukprot:3937856-Prorocentrum_lima.AAC.1
MSSKRGTLWFKNGESCELLAVLQRGGELFFNMTKLQFTLVRKAASETGKHPELVHTRRWWMQHHLKVQDLLQRETTT